MVIVGLLKIAKWFKNLLWYGPFELINTFCGKKYNLLKGLTNLLARSSARGSNCSSSSLLKSTVIGGGRTVGGLDTFCDWSIVLKKNFYYCHDNLQMAAEIMSTHNASTERSLTWIVNVLRQNSGHNMH